MTEGAPAPKQGGCGKVVLAGVVVLVLLGVGARVGAGVWANGRVADMRAKWKDEVAAERSRHAGRKTPLVRGTPLDENVVPRWKKIAATLSDGDVATLQKDLAAGKPLPPAALAFLEKYKGALVDVDEALRCTRLHWEFEYEKGMSAPITDLVASRRLGTLVVLDGYQKAALGDTAGGARRFVDVQRIGCDLSHQPTLVGTVVGHVVATQGQVALADLATAQLAAPLPWTELKTDLQLLEPDLGVDSLVDALRSERLLVIQSVFLGMESDKPEEKIAPLFAALELPPYDALLRTLEGAAALQDAPARRKKFEDAYALATSASPQSIMSIATPNFGTFVVDFERVSARNRILLAVATLEAKRLSDGKLPAPGEVSLPADPAGPAGTLLKHEALPEGYRISSVATGKEATRFGAQDKPLALERGK